MMTLRAHYFLPWLWCNERLDCWKRICNRSDFATGPWDACSARELATQHQRSDGGEIEQVEADAGRESRCVVAIVIVDDAGEPGAGRHAAAAEKQQRRHPPARLARREIFADRQHIGRH